MLKRKARQKKRGNNRQDALSGAIFGSSSISVFLILKILYKCPKIDSLLANRLTEGGAIYNLFAFHWITPSRVSLSLYISLIDFCLISHLSFITCYLLQSSPTSTLIHSFELYIIIKIYKNTWIPYWIYHKLNWFYENSESFVELFWLTDLDYFRPILNLFKLIWTDLNLY